MIILEEIRATLAGLMGAPYNTNPNLISFSSILSGSVIVGGLMDTTGSNPATSLTTATNKLGASPGFGSFDMTNSNFVANGFNPETEPTKINLPLVLGLSIPLGILLVVVVVIVIVKVRARNNDIREVTKVEVLPGNIGDVPAEAN
jgi:hypothetical protein